MGQWVIWISDVDPVAMLAVVASKFHYNYCQFKLMDVLKQLGSYLMVEPVPQYGTTALHGGW